MARRLDVKNAHKRVDVELERVDVKLELNGDCEGGRQAVQLRRTVEPKAHGYVEL